MKNIDKLKNITDDEYELIIEYRKEVLKKTIKNEKEKRKMFEEYGLSKCFSCKSEGNKRNKAIDFDEDKNIIITLECLGCNKRSTGVYSPKDLII